MLRVREIKPDPENPRRKLTDIRELAASIKAIGLQVPLRVERGAGGSYHIIDGSRRLSALKLLGMDSEYVPCVYSASADELPMSIAALPEAAREALARIAQHSRTRKNWAAYEAACTHRDVLRAGVAAEVIAATAACTVKDILRGQAVLGDLDALHYGREKYGVFHAARVHNVSPKTADLLIRSGHLKAAGCVRWIPVIMVRFKQPWKSRRTLVQLYTDALGRAAA